MMTHKTLLVLMAGAALAACGNLAPSGVSSPPSGRADDSVAHNSADDRGNDGANHDAGDDRGNDAAGHRSNDDRGGADQTDTQASGRTSRIAAPADQSYSKGSTVSIQIEKSRANDDNAYVFSSEGLPAGLTINADTGLISGVLTANAGIYNITISAREATEPARHRVNTAKFKLTVTP